MADLYNVKTKQIENIDNADELQQALIAGTHQFAKGQRVPVINLGGKSGTIPAEEVLGAIGDGFKVQTPSQYAVNSYVKENEGLTGTAKVALGQFADEALMGLPELIYDKTGDPLEVAKKDALKKQHDLANTVGGVAGFGASLVNPLTNPLFKGATQAGEAVAANIAEKLAVSSGEELGKRTASTVAKDILKSTVAKGLGGAVEGAILTAPTGVTEAVLGDPDEAAETLMAGVGFGGLFGGGGSLAKDFLKLGKDGVSAVASKVLPEGESPGKAVAKKVAKFFSGVDEDDIAHVAENLDRVNEVGKNYSKESIKDLLDTSVAKYADNVEVAKLAAKNAKDELDQAYQATKFDLANTRAPKQFVDDIQGALENQKAALGQLSNEADDALAQSNVSVSKEGLLNVLDNVQNSVGAGERKALIGDEAVAAVDKIKTLRSRIETGLDDVLDGPTTRDVLRQVRNDINYNQASGEFNDTVNKLKKSFTENVSSFLKDQSPEYAQYMAKMADMSDNLAQMSKSFGTPERAYSSLNTLFTPKGELKTDLLQKFGDLTDRNWIAELEDLNRAKAHGESLKKGVDLRGILLPELSEKAQLANQSADAAEAAYAPFRKLTPERTQAIIQNQGYKNASIQDKRALEQLSDATGQDLNTLIRDYNAYDAFSKSSVNGSRRAVIGGAAGQLFGGPLGAAIGAAGGGLLDLYGGQILKGAIDANKNVSGLLFAEKAMKRTAEKLDELPRIIDRMGSGVKAPSTQTKVLGAGVRIFERVKHENDDEGLKEGSRAYQLEQMQKFLNKSSNIVANPSIGANQIAALTAPVASKGAPNIGNSLNTKMIQAVNYLHQAAPKAPSPKNPFAPQIKYRPSDYDLSAWMQKASVVEDPFTVFSELEKGTLTNNHMEALKNVYPGIYKMMQKQVLKTVSEGFKPVPYQQRVKLSMLMDVPLDDTMTPEGIQFYQQTAAKNFAAEQAGEAQGSSQGFKGQVNLASQLESNTQRLQTNS